MRREPGEDQNLTTADAPPSPCSLERERTNHVFTYDSFSSGLERPLYLVGEKLRFFSIFWELAHVRIWFIIIYPCNLIWSHGG